MGYPHQAKLLCSIFPQNLPTMRIHHYSFDMQYDIGHNWVMNVWLSGNSSRDIYFHSNPQRNSRELLGML